MTDATRIEELIAPTVTGMGYEVVRVQLSGMQRPKLQVMVERGDRKTVTIGDCTEVSRAISALLDVEDPIAGAYVIEVSSPGIDRPLTRPDHFRRFAGFEARLECRIPVEGRRRFQGRIKGLDGTDVVVTTADGEARVPVEQISKAKLVLTDELIAATKDGTP